MNATENTISALITLIILSGAQAGTYTVVGGQVNNSGSIAIGAGSEAGDRQPTDEGQSVAIGVEADATGSRGIAIGKSAKATFVQGIAIGENAETTSSLGLAIGASAKAHYSAIALGLQANASESYSLAFGNNSTASGKNSIAFGKEAQATESGSIALGFQSSSSKSGSISMGSSANASHYDSIAFGSSAQSSGNRSIALGYNSSASNAGSLSIGSSSEASYQNSVALGRYAKAQATYGVALGADSVADRASGQTGYVPSVGKITSTLTPTWKSSLGAVSVGSVTGTSEKTRQIIHVAAGSEDTDAVNVAQLKASQTKLELESNLLTKTESKTADGITYTLGIDASKFPKTDIVAGKGVSVSKTDPMKPIVLLNDDQDFSGTVAASKFKVGSSASLDTTGLNLIGTSTVTLKDSNPSPEKKTVLSTEGISVSSTTSPLGTHLTADGLYIPTNVSLTKTGLVLGTGNPSVTTSGIKAGNKTITNLAEGSNDSDAVNVKQLKNARTTLQSSDENLVIASPSETNKGLNYSLSLKQDVNFTSVTIGTSGVILTQEGLAFGTNGVCLTNTGLILGDSNGPKFTTSGISAGGHQIENVRAGTEGTDAVNVQQMEAHVKANKSSVVSDDVRINVTPEEDSVNGGKKYKLSLNSDISLDSVKTDNATLSSDGLQITGGPSVTTTGIDAGSKEITNVARATTGTSAVNLNQMNDEIKKNKSSVAAGRGISVATSDDVENGGKKYTVSLNENTEFTEVKTGDTTISSNGVSIAGGPSMTKENGINAGGKVITNVAAGVNDTDAVNVSQLKQSKVTVKAKENGNITVEQSAATDNGTEYTVALNDSVSVNEVHVAQKVHLSSEGVRVGNSGPIIAESGIDAANRTISNVAPGVQATDAVNVAQLNSAVGNVFRQVHSVEKDAQAGIAMAIATAGLPQAYLPGKSMMAISGGTYRGQSGYAFGFSHVTDNGRYVIKASGGGNSQGHYGASVGMGWQW